MRLFSNRYASSWVLGLLAAGLVWLVSAWPGEPFTRVNTLVFDQYQRLQPRQWAGSDVVVVDIDEASLSEIGQWPWPRSTLAQMTDRLGELGAAAIVFDVIFAEPDRTSPVIAVDALRKAGAQVTLPAKVDALDNDATLAAAFARNNVVTGVRLSQSGSATPPQPKAGHAFSGSTPDGMMQQNVTSVRNLEKLDAAATGIGDISFRASVDGIVRKAVLIRGANDAFYPTLTMEALRVVQGAGSFVLKSSDGSGELSGGNVTMVSVKVGALEVPTDKSGALDIYHSPAAQKPVVSARLLLSQGNEEALKGALANHIVLIGTSAEGLLDLRATPLEPVVPGVFVHAEMLDQIIAGDFISRPYLARGVELLSAIGLTLILLAALPFLNAAWGGLLALGLAVLAIGAMWFGFSSQRLLFSPAVPVLSVLAAYGAAAAAKTLITERQGQFVREAFAHYLDPTLVEQLASQPEKLQLGGEDRELTLLFCDIRGFTSLSEGLEPTELTELLNDFLTPMTDALLKRGATIDKYMGDAIMAFWNAPLGQEDHRQRACDGMLAMRRALEKLNAKGGRPIKIGMGLNTGMCCVGNLGSQQRFNYSAIGDAVNVAARVEGLTKYYGLDNLVAEETLEGTQGFASLVVDQVAVVGRSQPLTVCTLMGDGKMENSVSFKELCERHDAMLDAYHAGDVEEALVQMARAREVGGESLLKLYAVYGERLALMRDEGVPDDWDGVFRATSK